MRILLDIKLPVGKFNEHVRKKTAGPTLKKILDDQKPEAVYFTEQGGQRSAILIVDLPDPSKVPALAEPWFLQFDAEVRFNVVMSPADLEKAGLDALAAKWA